MTHSVRQVRPSDPIAGVFAGTRLGGDVEQQRALRSVEAGLFGGGRRPLRLGRYRVGEAIAEGGAGTVYAGYDPELDRPVALKVLHGGRVGMSRASQRALVAEGRALARLAHPHIVAVYDVGAFDDGPVRGVYLVMERVDGGTLRQWLATRPRPWEEILEVFEAAGEGVAAAHEAGLVHRDFKPDNVILAADGRVQVADFGLAFEPPVDSGPGHGIAPAIVGTPGFMSPEQQQGATVDARSDQYSFCVAVRGALAGGVRPPTSRRSRAVQAVLRRGMADAPDDRFQSMPQLLRALARARQARSGGVGVAVTAAIIAVIGSAIWLNRGAPDPCEASADPLAGVWDPVRRSQLQHALLGTDVAYAADAWRTTQANLDEFADAWRDANIQACRAGHRAGQGEARDADFRMACLRRQRGRLRALVGVLSQADAEVVAKAGMATLALGDPATCATARSGTFDALPVDPDRRADAEAAEALVADASAHLDAGRAAEAAELSRHALELAERSKHAPLHAEALLLRGQLELIVGSAEDACELVEQAYFLGQSSRNESVQVEAAVRLVSITGYHLFRPDEATQWERVADALLTDAPADADLRATLLLYRGNSAYAQGDPSRALVYIREALRLLQQHDGPDSSRLVAPLNNLGVALAAVEQYDEALRVHRRVLRLLEAHVGDSHPDVAGTWHNIAVVHLGAGESAAAEHALSQAIAALQRGVGVAHPRMAHALGTLSEVRYDGGRYASALSLARRAEAVWSDLYGPEHPKTAEARVLQAAALLAIGDAAAALQVATGATETLRSTLGPSHATLTRANNVLAAARAEVRTGTAGARDARSR